MGPSVADDMRAQKVVAVTHPNFPFHDTHHRTIAHLSENGGYRDTRGWMSEIRGHFASATKPACL